MRERAAHFFQLQIAAFGNIQRARQHRRRIFENLRHLRMTLHKELVAVELHSVGVLNRLAGLYADHHVLGMRIVLAEVVAVIGGDQRQAEILLQLKEAGMDAVLHRETLILDLEVEILLSENIAERAGCPPGRLVVPFHQPLRHLALQTARESDQPLRMVRQKLLADARFVIEATQRCLGGYSGQIPVALFVLGEHQQVVIGIAFRRSALDVVVVFLADVQFAAHDRFDARRLGRIHEMHGSKDVAVIGHSDRGHAEFLHAVNEFLDVAGAIEHRVVSVQVQVNELRHEFRYGSFFDSNWLAGTGETPAIWAVLQCRTHCVTTGFGTSKSTPRSSFSFMVAARSISARGYFFLRLPSSTTSISFATA